MVKAYQYTSITSVMLLDCWSIPAVMLLTWLFLHTRYRFKKIAGVLVCITGLVVVVFSDVHAGDRAGGSNPRKGDLLVIAGATLYAISNVSEEYLVKNADRVELMSFLGLFGAIISAIQISILERNELKSIHWSAGAAVPFFGFAVAMFLFYSFVPVLLQINGATMLNLSLLTSDMWAVLIRIFAYHEKVDWMYFVAFAAVAVGLVIYSGGERGEDEQRSYVVGDEEDAEASKHFEEAASGSANHNQGAGTSSKV
ncbi:solute carrier family 35 member F1-like isoform X2 [Carica papaya]|uniref:solute carrier family 35 member F1-like isoform X2 n=1 Tax=Carica papaya TaxID=3649 RepID=UPI000B8CD8A7|nr:solute carrier family 35 member F1-like isoform X2 [Carica papaya]